ncbi:MAG TPA: hypothetical protein VHH14_08140 [Solirubrobacterales bacterium]|nr:hypothetical protein [Solirubrobacterales bacterium]
MKLRMMLVLGLAVLSLGVMPATGMADGVTYTPEGPSYEPDKPKPPKGPKYNPDKPKPEHPHGGPKGKAYGYYCKGQSKKHVKGEKGTAFSRCVKALARADKNESLHPKKACKGLSKKHVKGQKGTPFSRCVKAVNKMRKDERNATVTTSSVA